MFFAKGLRPFAHLGWLGMNEVGLLMGIAGFWGTVVTLLLLMSCD
jgi:hypothetical protein